MELYEKPVKSQIGLSSLTRAVGHTQAFGRIAFGRII